jgi:Ca2+-transporting ATPase
VSATAAPERARAAAGRPWHTLGAAEVARAQATDLERGLSEAEARRRLAEVGENALEDRGGRTIWQIAWEQVASVLIAILVVAGGVAAALGRPYDTAAILAIVVLFVVLGVVQEYRAQRAIAALKQMAAPVVRVVRDGRVRELSARELVPGDLVRLETGSAVPADLRLVESVNLRTQEAALTGESEPVDKAVAPVGDAEAPLGDRTNMAYAGTATTFGRGSGVVVATGMATELGRVAELLQEVRQEPTPLQRRLDGLAKVLALVAVGIALVVVLSGLARGEDVGLVLLTGVSLAVAIVPEGLPAVLTFTLALGARRMLGRRALIRRLPAVETLGSVTVICSDKTGTLTQNRMTVTRLEAPEATVRFGEDGPRGDLGAAAPLAAAGALCNDAVLDAQGAEAVGDPTEAALVVAAARMGLPKGELDAALPRVAEVPFDSARKRMTTVHRAAADHPLAALQAALGAPRLLALTKGAADAMLALCDREWVDGSLRPLDEASRAQLAEELDALTAEGMRVLGVGARGLEDAPAEDDADAVERDLVLLGLAAMVDPPRAEARDAVATCRTAGIRPVMITGDHPLTARAIAAELGMTRPGAPVVTGRELERLSGDELRRVVREVDVFARVSPEHKLRIVEALQAEGEVVAMTGDGVNDAPALKRADIGVAMGSGTDVAKEAADVVLLDDDFATIVAAVEEGRVVYDNVRRFVQFSVAGNVAKVLIVAVPPLLGLPLFLLPVMILFSNLLTDGLLGLGMGVERAERDTMRRPPIRPTESVFSRGVGAHIASVGPLIGVAVALVGWWAWERAGGSDAAVSDAEELLVATTVFTTLAFVQLGRALSARSFLRPVWETGLRGNPVLLAMLGAVLALQLLVVFAAPLQDVLSTVALGAGELLLASGLALVLLAAMELEKAHRRRAARAPAAGARR